VAGFCSGGALVGFAERFPVKAMVAVVLFLMAFTLNASAIWRAEPAVSAPTITTARLVLRPLREEDAPALFAYRSDPGVARFQGFVPRSVDDAAAFIREQRSVPFDTPGTWSQLAVRLRECDRLIGDVGVRPTEDGRQAEIGFTIVPADQRHGYATEAVRGLLGHLFGVLGKHRVFASVDPENAPSIALLERVGFRREAHHRRSLWFRGEWVDDVVHAMLGSEWDG